MDDLSNKKIEHYNKTILSLESLVRLVTTSKADSSIPVTLNVHGTLVSGELVSVANYHKFLKHTLLSNLQEKDGPEVHGSIKESFESLEAVPIIDENDTFILNYVCIREAKIYLSDSSPDVSIPYWIGKLESVDGFFIGEMETDSTPPLV